MLSIHQAQEVLGVRRCIGKNPSPTSTKDKAKLEYISEGQPSPLKLTFVVDFDINSHSKNLKIFSKIQLWARLNFNYFWLRIKDNYNKYH